MLRARSERQVRRGGAPLDVEAEVARLLAAESGPASHDPALVEEVRQMVVARNERRVRQGEQPLDVDAEVAARCRNSASERAPAPSGINAP